jgi:hypothetical protein
MKEVIKSAPYFSAYSLKALNASGSELAPAKGRGRLSKLINGLKVLPYSEKKISINKINIPVAIQAPDKNWFTNYE